MLIVKYHEEKKNGLLSGNQVHMTDEFPPISKTFQTNVISVEIEVKKPYLRGWKFPMISQNDTFLSLYRQIRKMCHHHWQFRMHFNFATNHTCQNKGFF